MFSTLRLLRGFGAVRAVPVECPLIVFDCDSTLSSIEGVDELARVKGPTLFAEVEAMTHAAMDGKISVESVFGQRLEIIQPSRDDVAAVGLRFSVAGLGRQFGPSPIDWELRSWRRLIFFLMNRGPTSRLITLTLRPDPAGSRRSSGRCVSD